METEYRIEPAVAADLPALVKLLEVLFAIEQDFTPQPEKQQRGLAALLHDVDRACIMVARNASGDAVGMASGQLVMSTAEGAYSLWVEDVVLFEAHRACGLGRLLLSALLAWAKGRGATRAQLLADLDNRAALDFYAHNGWHGTRLGAYRVAL